MRVATHKIMQLESGAASTKRLSHGQNWGDPYAARNEDGLARAALKWESITRNGYAQRTAFQCLRMHGLRSAPGIGFAFHTNHKCVTLGRTVHQRILSNNAGRGSDVQVHARRERGHRLTRGF